MIDMLELMKADPKIRVDLKEFPVLGRVRSTRHRSRSRYACRIQAARSTSTSTRSCSAAAADRQDERHRGCQGGRPRYGEAGKGLGRPGNGEPRRELQDRRGHGPQRHAELRNRQTGCRRRGRRRHLQGKDRLRPLRQGDLLRSEEQHSDEKGRLTSRPFSTFETGKTVHHAFTKQILWNRKRRGTPPTSFRCRRGQCRHLRRNSMTNRFLISVAAVALIAGTGLANAQGAGGRIAVRRIVSAAQRAVVGTWRSVVGDDAA